MTPGEADYTINGDLQFNFSAGVDRLCVQIEAIDDPILENDETLSLLLSTDVIHSSQPVLVTITDNDGWLCNSHLNIVHLLLSMKTLQWLT